jgi:hypothetical protein
MGFGLVDAMKGLLTILCKSDGRPYVKPKPQHVYLDKASMDTAVVAFDPESNLPVASMHAHDWAISAEGISIWGVERTVDPKGKVYYQQWWFRPSGPGKP